MKNQPTGTEAKVCDLIAARQRLGRAKYGTTVADNPLSLRQWLQHGLEEALDLAVYLQRSIDELAASGVGGQVAQASSGAGVAQGQSDVARPVAHAPSVGVAISEVRAHREKLEADVMGLVTQFRDVTGLSVVGFDVEIIQFHTIEGSNPQIYVNRVRVKTEQV